MVYQYLTTRFSNIDQVAALLDVDVRQLINKTKGTNSDD